MADDKLKLRAREVAAQVLLNHHSMLGSNPDAPLEKICNCGWRGVGLLTHDKHMREENRKRAAEIIAAFAAELVAEARVEEAKWLEQYLHNGHTRDCTFDNATGDEGDYCSCGMAQRRADVSKHLAELEATLASLRTPQTEGGR